MVELVGWAYAVGCGGLVLFQIALIGGAPWGVYTQGGQHPGALPPRGRALAALSIPILVFMGLAILSAAGVSGLVWPPWTGWVACAVSGLSCAANWATPSKKERALWGPITLILVAMAVYVMVRG